MADADGGNPDNISVTLGIGENKVDQDFEDFNSLKLGNRVWADIDNSGTINNGESGIGNVTLQLYLADGGGNPTGLPLGTLITDPNGYYRFDGLVPGTYVVVVPNINFSSGQPLDGLLSSGSGVGTFNGVDPDLNPTDSDDNGNNPFNPLVSGVRSAAVTLAYDSEPGGTDLGPGDFNNTDSNLTVDFGFTQPLPTVIRLVYLKGWSVNGRVTVEWETLSELNTVGFQLYRLGTDDSWVPVGGFNPALNDVGGGVYRVFDADLLIPSLQRYVLMEFENNGKENTYGPFEVDVRLAAVESGIRVFKGNIEVCYGGMPDVEYEVESTDDLNAGRWVSLGRVRADAAGLAIFREALTESKKFYRALQP